MISVEEAEKIIRENAPNFGTEKVVLQESIGKILAEDLCADRDFPPFDRVTMDGIALQFNTLQQGNKTFPIEYISPAGSPQRILENPKNCIEVMTGTILPKHCDTVIRYEDLQIEKGKATLQIYDIKKGQNIHQQASDRKMGEVIVPKGRRISPAEIGVAATIGKVELQVERSPKVLIISTGDELVPLTATPQLHQIRSSNNFAIQAALKEWGITAQVVHLKDDEELIEKNIKNYLAENDVLILSGGVSAGKFDFIPRVLAKQGVIKLFHKVAQKPGKPLWFGRKAENKFVFALPGNPVSTFLCLQRYFKFWLNVPHEKNEELRAELSEDVFFKANLTYFLQVKLKKEKGKLLAQPYAGNGSGDLANLSDADAFIELPVGKDKFEKGENYKIYPYRNIF